MTILQQASLILPILCLIFLAYLFNKEILRIFNKLLFIEKWLKLDRGGDLKRMLTESNKTIRKLRGENKELKLALEIKDMNDSLEGV